jgi:DNA-binding GntR family transcriptional regulator
MEALVNSKTLQEQVYSTLLDAISDGTLKPGERLTQQSVADRLNVSRQPIHNALQLLKSQGFVAETGRRGLVVAPVDPRLLEEIYQFRSAIEPLSVRLAIARVTPALLQRGREILARGAALARGDKTAALAQADIEFHFFIYELSDNSLVLESMRLNWRHLRRSMGEVLRLPARAERVWREHARIFAAIESGDVDGAQAEMSTHMMNAYRDVQSSVLAETGRQAPRRRAAEH